MTTISSSESKDLTRKSSFSGFSCANMTKAIFMIVPATLFSLEHASGIHGRVVWGDSLSGLESLNRFR
jgi:hypothetical protein